jgi:uncharacterized membrane protein
MFLALLPVGFFGYSALFHPQHWADAATIAFDLAAAVFVLSLIPLLRDADGEVIRRHADANNANRVLVLIITSLLTMVVMVAISGELDNARRGEVLAIVKLAATLLLVWLFANSVFALHYAHAYYSPTEGGGDAGGLDFPGTKEPAYSDFTYFAFTLGMTFQTSDTGITSPRIRAVAILHSFAAYIFSIGVIAFTINSLGGK